jgi:hypothetical protein
MESNIVIASEREASLSINSIVTRLTEKWFEISISLEIYIEIATIRVP